MKKYLGKKELRIIEGDHGSERGKEVTDYILEYLKLHLTKDGI